MSIIKKITAFSIATAILTCGLAGCGSNNTDDTTNVPDTSETLEIVPLPEIPEEPIPNPETYEDYMKLAVESYGKQDWESALAFYQGAKDLDDGSEEVYRGMSDTYLQMDDVIQALAVLDEGIEKLRIDSLSQRKEYILAGTVAIRTKLMENTYDGDGSILYGDVLEYDENGNEIQETHYREGEISSIVKNQYDENGSLIEYEFISYDSDGNSSYLSHETWEYDVFGNEIEYKSYNNNGNVRTRAESEYDSNGNLVRHTEYDKEGKIVTQEEMTYDTEGNQIQYEIYNENGICTKSITKDYDAHGNQIGYIATEYDDSENITVKEECEYDENGNIIKFFSYDSAGDIKRKEEYEYNENGSEVKYTLVNGWGESITKRGYDENGRELYSSYEEESVVASIWEHEYDERGNQIKIIHTEYDEETGQKECQTIFEYAYDENNNMTKYAYTYEGGKENFSHGWEREYDADGRGNAYYYDNEKTAFYQSKSEYDENGMLIKYTGYDKEGIVLVWKETEYDEFGKIIKENHDDADGNLIQYYENEYDDFDSVTRQAMYEDGILKSEKLMCYVYRYIGNMDAETTDYRDDDITPEEYNLKQREVFTRFLQGMDKVRFCSDTVSEEYGIRGGRVVEKTITDLIGFEGCRLNREVLEYTFLDMTGDGIEELIIRCNGRELYVIQCDYGILKVICDAVGIDNAYLNSVYLIEYNGKAGVYTAYGRLGSSHGYCYFMNGNGKKKIALGTYYDRFTESFSYSMYDNDSFEWHDISEGEYFDIDEQITVITIDWQKLKKSTL